MDIRGLYPALITPFDAALAVGYGVLRDVVRVTRARGVTGFYVGGSTAETFSLTVEEREKILETVMEEAGGLPVIAHVGVLNPHDLKRLCRHAASVGVAAVSSVPPFYYKHSEAEITAYYLDIAAASGLKVLLYNIPQFTGVALTKKNCAALFASGMVAGIKHTSQNLYDLERLKNTFPDSVMLAGHDEVFCPAQLMGAEGCIGSTLNLIPDRFVAMDRLLAENNPGEAMRIQHTVNDLVEAMMHFSFFAVLKFLMTVQGLPVGGVRPPLLDLTDDEKTRALELFQAFLA
ncbi:MAG: dihydrodipicolinate synthase family protein [Planctomycetaceae bacterium]|nr:dihydrodipicolinate synthase family protein [Planctomycetaceae bacterium]